MRVRAVLAGLSLLADALLAGCAYPPGVASGAGGPMYLGHTVMIGIEPMVGDPLPGLPFTNRLLDGLAAMPGVRVVYLGAPRNAWPFDAEEAWRIRLSPWLHGEGYCMTAQYTTYAAGQQQGVYGIITPRLSVGSETDLECVDRFATDFYRALVRQGF
jgi:hypothetical protein